MSNLPKATQHTYELGASAQAHLQSVTRVTLLVGALCLAAHSIAQDAVLTSSGIGYTTNNGTATIVDPVHQRPDNAPPLSAGS